MHIFTCCSDGVDRLRPAALVAILRDCGPWDCLRRAALMGKVDDGSSSGLEKTFAATHIRTYISVYMYKYIYIYIVIHIYTHICTYIYISDIYIHIS